jgi:hypothetical protein
MLKTFATRDLDGVKFLALRSSFERREAIIAAARVSSGKAQHRLLEPTFSVIVPRFPMHSFGNYNTIGNAATRSGKLCLEVGLIIRLRCVLSSTNVSYI